MITASDGFDALAKIVDHRPGIIFVDVLMPRLDGYQTCASSQQRFGHPGDPGRRATGRQGPRPGSRPDQFLTKPFSKKNCSTQSVPMCPVLRHLNHKHPDRAPPWHGSTFLMG